MLQPDKTAMHIIWGVNLDMVLRARMLRMLLISERSGLVGQPGRGQPDGYGPLVRALSISWTVWADSWILSTGGHSNSQWAIEGEGTMGVHSGSLFQGSFTIWCQNYTLLYRTILNYTEHLSLVYPCSRMRWTCGLLYLHIVDRKPVIGMIFGCYAQT